MSKMPGAPRWDKASVLDQLDAEEKRTGAPVEAQLFLEESVAPEKMTAMVQQALDEEAARAGANPADIALGRARLLSRSITARAPVAVLRGVMSRTGFKALLPANPLSADVTVRPVRTHPSEPLGHMKKEE